MLEQQKQIRYWYKHYVPSTMLGPKNTIDTTNKMHIAP